MPPRKSNRQGKRLGRAERLTADVRSIVHELETFLKTKDSNGRLVCAAKCGVYAFFDYDDEPIYVGQTYERLRVRMRRHLTNQRTDAVAMHVLDPMEVARVEVWPFWDLETASKPEQRKVLDAAEYTISERLAKRAQVSKLLNEKMPSRTRKIRLPPSYSMSIVPEEVRLRLGHSDERIARRAATIANLAQVVRERDVSSGLRQTLVTQAERLELLASKRLEEVTGETTREYVEEEPQQKS